MTLEKPVASKEYILVPLTYSIGGESTDPTAGTVEIAIVARGAAPTSGDWVAGAWEPNGPPYFGRILVGPVGSGAAMERGTGSYDVWARVTLSPEQPVRKSGAMNIV